MFSWRDRIESEKLMTGDSPLPGLEMFQVDHTPVQAVFRLQPLLGVSATVSKYVCMLGFFFFFFDLGKFFIFLN